jgi:hypothetical protein
MISEQDSMHIGSEKSGQSVDLDRSVTPNRGTEVSVENETIEDYLKFPDPKKYLVGFISGIVALQAP